MNSFNLSLLFIYLQKCHIDKMPLISYRYTKCEKRVISVASFVRSFFEYAFSEMQSVLYHKKIICYDYYYETLDSLY